MLVLCFLVLVILGADVVLKLDDDTRTIFQAADTAICAVFVFDFLLNLWHAPSRWRYFTTWGWIELLSSVPAVDALRWGRAARMFRILRLLRGVRSTRILAQRVPIDLC